MIVRVAATLPDCIYHIENHHVTLVEWFDTIVLVRSWFDRGSTALTRYTIVMFSAYANGNSVCSAHISPRHTPHSMRSLLLAINAMAVEMPASNITALGPGSYTSTYEAHGCRSTTTSRWRSVEQQQRTILNKVVSCECIEARRRSTSILVW